jgi:hypothetical protein
MYKCSVVLYANTPACGADPADLPNPVFSPKTIIMSKYRLFLGKKEVFLKNLENGDFGIKTTFLKV